MATCKECIHYDMCPQAQVIEKTHICKHFKDKSRFVEVPCKIGDTAWAVRVRGRSKRAESGIVDGLGISKDMQVIVNIRHLGCGIWGQKIFPTEEAVIAAMEKEGADNG